MLLLHSDKPKPVASQGAGQTAPQAVNADQAVKGVAGVLEVGEVIAKLRAEKPEYIAIGNSMIFSRFGFTPDEMNKLTGHKFFFILRGGTTTAAWYLTLKNVVAASGIHPKLVFFFFRHTELTSPYVNTNGDNAPYLNSLRGPSEPVVDDLLHPPPARGGFVDGAVDNVSRWLNGPEGVYNFSAGRDDTQRRLTNLAMRAGGLKTRNRQWLADRFTLENLRYDVPADMGGQDSGNDAPFDPYQSLSTNYVNPEGNSFLPPIMEVAREHGFKLLFFRVKRRPEAETGLVSEPQEMRGYVQRLQRWIEERGGLFYDESYDPAIKLEAYNDGDHVGAEHRDWYRKYFWQRMAPIFP